MENTENDQKSTFFRKIDDIEAFVDESWGFMSNFKEIREQLIQDVKDHQALLEQEMPKMDKYGELMRQRKYMEAASLIITPEDMDKALRTYGDVYFFYPKAKIVTEDEGEDAK